ncbi:hypothetical protein IRJ41_008924 [Triplophysa rosa]|uniref:PARP catalytic domain-containing protein n=1 Tax=Triplophysa rosa TaxID=992332 RepID=A0A9W7WSN6_TRIRA|nr:hypothetical protein IRJ41_008924 [Triplophysa rosa]
MEKEVVLEALSALLGVPVKSGSKGASNVDELSIWNLLSTLLFGRLTTDLVLGGLGEGLRDELFVDMDEFFDPKYDYDFTRCNDKSTCMRGNEAYKRPCGWNRIAVKVLDKYPDGNVWLGTDGWRSHSVAGEWPVSYHGTSIEGAKSIVTSHYKAGPRDLYGRGIYSTYDIDQASGYSKEFTSKTNGKTYRVLMQNRINPQMRKVCKRTDYWLIEIPEGTSPEKEREIVENSIRPYGILLKQV